MDHPENIQPVEGSRGEVLIVDDSAASLAYLSSMLTAAGYQVREAPSGELALMTLKVRIPELILLDVRMPEMDGFEVCRRIKADPVTQGIPVIFLSAQDDTTDKVQGLKVGAVDFISKTFAQEEMLARIDTHITLERVKKALERERSSLEDRVRERTNELFEELTQRLKMEQENRALERALWQSRKMEAIGQLAGGIAHDFNHLLSLILGFTQFAQTALANGKTDKLGYYLDEVMKAGTEGQAVVTQLLAFSRNEEVTQVAIDLGPVVTDTIQSLRQALSANLVLRLELAPELPQVAIKPIQLKQILTNLVFNARDALVEKGCITVRLDRERIDTLTTCHSCRKPFQGDFLVLSVADNGSGITPDIIDKIFEPFFTTKDVSNGVGLGLPMVHGIVHSAGGHIQVTSASREETRFLVMLPYQHNEPT